jgi:hypothetical protein
MQCSQAVRRKVEKLLSQFKTKIVRSLYSVYNVNKVCKLEGIFKYTKILIALLFLALPSLTHAQKSGTWSLGAMALFGTGKMGNGDLNNLAPERTMEYFPMSVFIARHWNRLRLGLNYEYVIANQATSPSEVNFTNLTGKESSVGLRADWYNGKFGAGVILKASPKYTLTKTTGDGNSSSYTATYGLGVQMMLQARKEIGIVVDYSTTTYNESLPDSDVTMNRVSLGLVFSNFKGGR